MSQQLTHDLSGVTVAILTATEGIEQVEMTHPWQALEGAGATVHLLSTESGKVRGFHHLTPADTFAVDREVRDAAVGDYDALILPGGVANPDALRTDADAVAFVRDFVSSGKPVAAICHAPWTLIEAGVVRGRTMTSWPSLQTDIRNAGGVWVDEQVVEHANVITSRNPDDLEAFTSAIADRLAAD